MLAHSGGHGGHHHLLALPLARPTVVLLRGHVAPLSHSRHARGPGGRAPTDRGRRTNTEAYDFNWVSVPSIWRDEGKPYSTWQVSSWIQPTFSNPRTKHLLIWVQPKTTQRRIIRKPNTRIVTRTDKFYNLKHGPAWFGLSRVRLSILVEPNRTRRPI